MAYRLFSPSPPSRVWHACGRVRGRGLGRLVRVDAHHEPDGGADRGPGDDHAAAHALHSALPLPTLPSGSGHQGRQGKYQKDVQRVP